MYNLCCKRANPAGLLVHGFLDGNSHGNGGTNHGVVTHADETHHFNVSGHGGRTGELSIAVHAAQRVGHAVRGGTCSHVVRVQGTARTTTGSNGEVLLTLLDALFLVSAGNGVLETGGVGGVTGDGNVHALVVHDCNAFTNVVTAIAVNGSTLAGGVGNLLDDLQLTGVVVKLSLNIGEAVDTGDDLSSVLAQAVQDNAQGLLTYSLQILVKYIL